MFCLSPLTAGLCNGYPRTKVLFMYGGLLLMALSMIGASFAQTVRVTRHLWNHLWLTTSQSVQLILTQGFALGIGEVRVSSNEMNIRLLIKYGWTGLCLLYGLELSAGMVHRSTRSRKRYHFFRSVVQLVLVFSVIHKEANHVI